jgi:hypothetical protein
MESRLMAVFLRTVGSLALGLPLLCSPAAGFDLGDELRNLGRSIDKNITQPFVAEPLKDIKEEAIEAVTGTDKGDLIRDTQAQYAASRREIETAIASAESQFSVAIGDLNDSIAEIEYMGIDPRRVRSEDGSLVDMVMIRDDLVAQRDAALRDLNANLASLSVDEAAAIRSIEETYR